MNKITEYSRTDRDKLLFIIISILASVFPILGIQSTNNYYFGIILLLLLCIYIDIHSQSIFCKIIIEDIALVYKKGGMIAKLFCANNKYYWDQCEYIAEYQLANDKKHYNILLIKSCSGKCLLRLTDRQIKYFDKLIGDIKLYNKNVKEINLDEWAQEKALKYYKIFKRQ